MGKMDRSGAFGNLDDYVTCQETAEIEGVRHQYLVVDRRFDTTIHYFAGVHGNKDLFVSDAVPSEFRRAVIAHVLRFELLMHVKASYPGINAAAFELKFVEAGDRQAYVDMRERYFNDLIKSLGEDMDPFLLEQAIQSRDHLLRYGIPSQDYLRP